MELPTIFPNVSEEATKDLDVNGMIPLIWCRKLSLETS